MKRYAVAAFLLAVGLTTPAFAAEHYAVMDTVGNCSVIDTRPSAASGLKILGDKGGYDTQAAAQKAFGSQCKGSVSRA